MKTRPIAVRMKNTPLCWRSINRPVYETSFLKQTRAPPPSLLIYRDTRARLENNNYVNCLIIAAYLALPSPIPL